MPDKKAKGKWNNYTEIPVNMRDYYYDRHETDKPLQNDFGDMLADLRGLNDKLKGELKKGEKIKIDISGDEENKGKGKDLNDEE